jgi:hypothetical protein
MKPIVVWGIAVLGLVAAGAVDARAQMTMGTFKGYLTGHVGAITGGDVTDPRLAAGASVAVHESNGWGAELDFGHTSDAVTGSQLLDVTTYLVNAMWVKPEGRIRPFAGAGAGILQISGCGVTCSQRARTYDFGLSASGGAFVAIDDQFGVRADARYFFSSAAHRDLRRPDGIAFWRLSLGVTYMWAVLP